MNRYFLIGCYCIIEFSCSRLTDEELWLKVENAKANNNWDSTKQVCERILAEYPSSNYAAWAQFGLAESFRFTNRSREALDNYKIFYEHYSDKQPAALSLFLIGYIYNNDLQQPDSAKTFYQLFLEKYPSHDLVPTVKFELETFGLSPQEALDIKQKAYIPTEKK